MDPRIAPAWAVPFLAVLSSCDGYDPALTSVRTDLSSAGGGRILQVSVEFPDTGRAFDRDSEWSLHDPGSGDGVGALHLSAETNGASVTLDLEALHRIPVPDGWDEARLPAGGGMLPQCANVELDAPVALDARPLDRGDAGPVEQERGLSFSRVYVGRYWLADYAPPSLPPYLLEDLTGRGWTTTLPGDVRPLKPQGAVTSVGLALAVGDAALESMGVPGPAWTEAVQSEGEEACVQSWRGRDGGPSGVAVMVAVAERLWEGTTPR